MKNHVDVEIRVRYAETDQMGVAYYANYLVWFEVGRSEFCRHRGFRYADLEAMGYKLVVTDVHCRYRSAARYDEILTARTWLKKMNRRMITFGYQILRQESGEVIAEGETSHLCLDSKNRPKTLPEEFASLLSV
jgi:acyl-CoA thioester hydrolase